MSICLIDTSIFCNALDVPQRNQQRQQVFQQLEEYIRSGVRLLLPITAIIETGNHIAQLNGGHTRRTMASRFVAQEDFA